MRFAPSATSTEPSPATAMAPTPLSWPGLDPAMANSRRKTPSGPKTCTTWEPWSATNTEPSGPIATAWGKRMTPSARCPTCDAPT